MTGVDTNVLLRILLGDDPIQSPVAKRLLRCAATGDEAIFVSVAAVLEVVWVLRSQYKMQAEDICEALYQLLSSTGVHVQNESEVFLALSLFQEGHASFEDAFIGALGIWAGCQKTLTFDKAASRLPVFELAQ